ncbi:LytTR family transcriptional regulator DNA-binding domain-containing protein [Cyclobacterium roseum]|uniref:LytTR family transcriptional regulator DNA-binding domain-containing protein n=1 Tax=Cyclobacterium roseum TaxID=2666137 RepID=UPI0037425E52
MQTIHCLDGSGHSCCCPLKSMQDELTLAFKKINRRCLVSCVLIQSIHGKKREITIQNDLRQLVSKSKRTSIKKELVPTHLTKKAIQNTS